MGRGGHERELVTVIGGGLAGLVAAITAAECGAPVRLVEARGGLGGRARSSVHAGVTVNFGAHALYADGALWAWLADRGLLPPVRRSPSRGVVFVHEGAVRRLPPPAGVVAMLRITAAHPPSTVSFAAWAQTLVGARAAAMLGAAAVNVTFDHDPGRLAAAFVRERLVRILRPASPVRYVLGGWQTLVDRLAVRAGRLGVQFATGQRVARLPAPPVVVATELGDARRLLDDDGLRWPGTRAVLFDVALTRRRSDPAVVFDLDRRALLERFTAVDASLAPGGTEIVQSQLGLRPGESVDAGHARLEAAFDEATPGWRERVRWSRRMVADGRSGAVDLPGTTWRDRPAVDRGGGVFVAGDMVAAPGILAEVACASAVAAGRGAAGWSARR